MCLQGGGPGIPIHVEENNHWNGINELRARNKWSSKLYISHSTVISMWKTVTQNQMYRKAEISDISHNVRFCVVPWSKSESDMAFYSVLSLNRQHHGLMPPPPLNVPGPRARIPGTMCDLSPTNEPIFPVTWATIPGQWVTIANKWAMRTPKN